MNPIKEDITLGPVRLILGDCRETLKTLPDESVQCCVTSPPYWGLRDYGCKGQIGLESAMEDYVGQLVAVFREVRRVLRGDGTLWLNLGDSYTGSRAGDQGASGQMANRSVSEMRCRVRNKTTNAVGLKPKDLCGIPWRVAFALQADGWWLRQDIIWAKPNPMPESVTDRCTKAHEYLFLLSKSDRYYWDLEAMREPATFDGPNSPESIKSPYGQGFTRTAKSGNLERKPASARGVPVDSDGSTNGAVAGNVPWEGSTRNKRSVWSVSTVPFNGAHFATFPPDLVKPCILAGTKPGDTVLDPFSGSGTVGMVATELGRKAILCELNPEYVKLSKYRTDTTMGLPLP